MDTAAEESGQSVHLSEIGQVALTVRDIARAKNFYQNILGMQFLFEAGTMVFFQCGTIQLMIGASEKLASNDGTILYFRVPDIHAVHTALTSRGVSIVQEPHLVARMKSHNLWISFLKDPDGNALALMCEMARTQTMEESK